MRSTDRQRAEGAPRGSSRQKPRFLAAANGAGLRWRVRQPNKREEPACKPGSVEGNHSSGIHVTVNLKRPTRKRARIGATLSRQRSSWR
jgi:hypothetical protein